MIKIQNKKHPRQDLEYSDEYNTKKQRKGSPSRANASISLLLPSSASLSSSSSSSSSTSSSTSLIREKTKISSQSSNKEKKQATNLLKLESFKMGEKEVKCEKYIGRGAFGNVYIGNWGLTKVAIKFYKLVSEKPFVREVDCLIKCLPARNVLKICGFGRMDSESQYPLNYREKNFYMVSEYCGNNTLRHLINNYKPDEIAWSDKEQIMLDLIQAIMDIHKAGICHHDIKPENVLISDVSNRATLADFGMATYRESEFRKQGKGTIQYSPPEAFGDNMSTASDIWSLGVMFYELCSHGELPFDGKNEVELKKSISKSEPMEFKQRFHVPSLWVNVIQNMMLCKEPKKRISASSILNYLEKNKISKMNITMQRKKLLESERQEQFASIPYTKDTTRNNSFNEKHMDMTNPTVNNNNTNNNNNNTNNNNNNNRNNNNNNNNRNNNNHSDKNNINNSGSISGGTSTGGVTGTGSVIGGSTGSNINSSYNKSSKTQAEINCFSFSGGDSTSKYITNDLILSNTNTNNKKGFTPEDNPNLRHSTRSYTESSKSVTPPSASGKTLNQPFGDRIIDQSEFDSSSNHSIDDVSTFSNTEKLKNRRLVLEIGSKTQHPQNKSKPTTQHFNNHQHRSAILQAIRQDTAYHNTATPSPSPFDDTSSQKAGKQVSLVAETCKKYMEETDAKSASLGTNEQQNTSNMQQQSSIDNIIFNSFVNKK